MPVSGALDRLRKQILWRLKEKGVRQGVLADYLGKSSGWMTMVLQGKRGIRLDLLDPIAAFFQVPPSVLLVDPDIQSPRARRTVSEASHAQTRALKGTSALDQHRALITQQQNIIERQQIIIDHALSQLRPLVDGLETVAALEFAHREDVREATRPRQDLPKRGGARSANGRR